MVKGVCVTLIEGCMRGAISYSDFKSKYSSAVLFAVLTDESCDHLASSF